MVSERTAGASPWTMVKEHLSGASPWIIGIAYGLGALFLVSGIAPQFGWMTLLIFLSVSLPTLGLQRLPVAHIHRFSPKDPWVAEWEALMRRPVR